MVGLQVATHNDDVFGVDGGGVDVTDNNTDKDGDDDKPSISTVWTTAIGWLASTSTSHR